MRIRSGRSIHILTACWVLLLAVFPSCPSPASATLKSDGPTMELEGSWGSDRADDDPEIVSSPDAGGSPVFGDGIGVTSGMTLDDEAGGRTTTTYDAAGRVVPDPGSSFSAASGLELETPTIEYRNGSEDTTSLKIPGLKKFTNITLKRGTPGLNQELDLPTDSKHTGPGLSSKGNEAAIESLELSTE